MVVICFSAMKRYFFITVLIALSGFLLIECSGKRGSARDTIYFGRGGEREIQCLNGGENGIMLDGARIILGSDSEEIIKILASRRFLDVSSAKLKAGMTLYTTARKRRVNPAFSQTPLENLTVIANEKGKIISIGWSESYGARCHPPIIITDGFCEEVMKKGRITGNVSSKSDRSFSFIYIDEKKDIFIVQNKVGFSDLDMMQCELDIANTREALKGISKKK